MILNVTRSYILLKADDNIVKIEGEIAGLGSQRGPYFVADANSVSRCEDSKEVGSVIDVEQRERILTQLKEDAREKHLALEIE